MGRCWWEDSRLSLGVVEPEVRPGGRRPTGRLGKRSRVKRRTEGAFDGNVGAKGHLGGAVG